MEKEASEFYYCMIWVKEEVVYKMSKTRKERLITLILNDDKKID